MRGRLGYERRILLNIPASSAHTSSADDDVVDGNVNEFDEEADESHYGEADGRRHGDLHELLPVWLGAALDQTHRVLGELAHGLQLQKKGIHDEV